MLVFLLFLFTFIRIGLQHKVSFCNQDTIYACLCNRCWNRNTPIPYGDSWVTVNFERCSNFSRMNESEIRMNLANWMNEECAFVLRCPYITNKWESSNIIIGDFHCNEYENLLRLLVLKNPLDGYKPSNIVHWNILYAIIESREHLLSTLLYSDLSIVSITTKPEADIHEENEEKDTPSPIFNSIPPWVIYGCASFAISFLSTLFIFCFIVSICLNWRLNWRDMVVGSWWITTPKMKTKLIHGVQKGRGLSNFGYFSNKPFE